MSRRPEPLIRKAAAMFMTGYKAESILKELNIRHATLMRYEQAALYATEIERLTRQMQARLAMRLLRMLDDASSTVYTAIALDKQANRFNPKPIATAMDLLQLIEKQKSTCVEQATKRHKEAHNGPQKAPNGAAITP